MEPPGAGREENPLVALPEPLRQLRELAYQAARRDPGAAKTWRVFEIVAFQPWPDSADLLQRCRLATARPESTQGTSKTLSWQGIELAVSHCARRLAEDWALRDALTPLLRERHKRAYANGDRQAAKLIESALFEMYQPYVELLAQKVARRDEAKKRLIDVHDCLSTAHLGLLQTIRTPYKPERREGHHFMPLLTTIVRRRLKDLLGKKRMSAYSLHAPTPDAEGKPLEYVLAGPEDSAARKLESQDALKAAKEKVLPCLTKKQRVIFAALCDDPARAQEELAEQTGVTFAHFRVILSEIKRRLSAPEHRQVLVELLCLLSPGIVRPPRS